MYTDNVVKKPWGYEYLCYQNEVLAIWVLHIKHNMNTSLHCHPNKHTGLVVLEGTAEVSFLRGNVRIPALEKIHIFKSRFHSTKALSDNGIYMLEIETPEDKHDLVRLDDSYGRENEGYEGKAYEFPKDKDCLWISEPDDANIVRFKGCCISHLRPDSKEDLFGFKMNEFFILTRGGIITRDGSQILWPADVIDGASLERLLKRFDLKSYTNLLHIKKI